MNYFPWLNLFWWKANFPYADEKMAVSVEQWFCEELSKLGIDATEENAEYVQLPLKSACKHNVDFEFSVCLSTFVCPWTESPTVDLCIHVFLENADYSFSLCCAMTRLRVNFYELWIVFTEDFRFIAIVPYLITPSIAKESRVWINWYSDT